MNDISKTRTKKHYVYILKDPYDLKIRYVGITQSLARRIKEQTKCASAHIRKNKGNPAWFLSLKIHGVTPIFQIVKECDDFHSARNVESMLIKKLSDTVFNTQREYGKKHRELSRHQDGSSFITA